MSWLNNISFAAPWAFGLLLLAPLLWWWWQREKGRRYPNLRMSSLAALAEVRSWRGRLRPLLPWLRVLAMLLLVVALARPRKNLQEEKITGEGIDIVLAIDLSSSMLAQDFKPNRLEASKRVAIDFVQNREFDRFSIVAFAGESFTHCPLTTDHEVVRTFLASLECGALADGTAIGQGLATAVNRLKDSKAKSKVIILLTDGVNTAGYIAPEKAAEVAASFGIKVYTIGVGSTGEAMTPVSRDRFGNYRYDRARVEIDEKLLRDIAAITDGQYFRATSNEELAKIYNLIDQLEKTEIESTVVRRYSEEFRLWVLLAVGLLLLEFLLRYTLLRAIP
ncbi:MAG: VWA domain-containing protein [Bacteroidetes bacterium]|nr:MAG: VWA domain-containing protein [Bacteroidota bacterium]